MDKNALDLLKDFCLKHDAILQFKVDNKNCLLLMNARKKTANGDWMAVDSTIPFEYIMNTKIVQSTDMLAYMLWELSNELPPYKS